MGYTTYIIPVLLLAGSSTANAEYWYIEPAKPAVTRADEWAIVAPDMSPPELRQATLHNQHLLGDTLRTYSENAFTSIGFSKKNIDFMGAAIGLAVRDARFHLDDSKLLALELKDVAKDERALFFGINIDW